MTKLLNYPEIQWLYPKRVNEGENYPRGYGCAHYFYNEKAKPEIHYKVCYPMPLNLFVIAWLHIRWWMKFRAKFMKDLQAEGDWHEESFRKGVEAGKMERRACKKCGNDIVQCTSYKCCPHPIYWHKFQETSSVTCLLCGGTVENPDYPKKTEEFGHCLPHADTDK